MWILTVATALRRLLSRLQALASGHDLDVSSSSSSESDNSFNSLLVPAEPVTASRVPPRPLTPRPVTQPQHSRVVFSRHHDDDDVDDQWLHPIVGGHRRRSWLRRDSPPVPTISPPATITSSQVVEPTEEDDQFYEQIQRALTLSMSDQQPSVQLPDNGGHHGDNDSTDSDGKC